MILYRDLAEMLVHVNYGPNCQAGLWQLYYLLEPQQFKKKLELECICWLFLINQLIIQSIKCQMFVKKANTVYQNPADVFKLLVLLKNLL